PGRGRDRDRAKRGAPWREIALLDGVEPVNGERRSRHQRDVPIVLALERPQLNDTIRAHGDKLYAERRRVLGKLIELRQFGDAIRAPIAAIEFQQNGRSQIRKSEFLAVGVEP